MFRNDGVEQRQSGAGHVDHLMAARARLAVVRVVIAAHVVQPIAKGRDVVVEERLVFIGLAVPRQVALGQHRCRGDRRDLFDGAPVHGLRVRGLTGRHRKHGSPVEPLDHAALGLSEMDIVDRRERGQEFTGRAQQRAYFDPGEDVVGIGLQVVEAEDGRGFVEDDMVVGHCGELDRHRAQARQVSEGRPVWTG